MYTWRTREDGVVVIRDHGEDLDRILILSGKRAALMDSVEARWGDRARVIGGRFGLPDGWLQAHIFRESGGNQRAFRQEPKPKDEVEGWTGIGLLQITHPALKGRKKTKVGTVVIDGEEKPLWKWVGGYTDEQLYESNLNLEIGSSYLAQKIKAYGLDFPVCSAAFNAGSRVASTANPWGMRHTAGHVTEEVSALNYYLARSLPQTERDQILASVYLTSQQSVRGELDGADGEDITRDVRKPVS